DTSQAWCEPTPRRKVSSRKIACRTAGARAGQREGFATSVSDVCAATDPPLAPVPRARAMTGMRAPRWRARTARATSGTRTMRSLPPPTANRAVPIRVRPPLLLQRDRIDGGERVGVQLRRAREHERLALRIVDRPDLDDPHARRVVLALVPAGRIERARLVGRDDPVEAARGHAPGQAHAD